MVFARVIINSLFDVVTFCTTREYSVKTPEVIFPKLREKLAIISEVALAKNESRISPRSNRGSTVISGCKPKHGITVLHSFITEIGQPT